MSKMPIVGLVCAAGLAALAIVPQVSTAAVQGGERATATVTAQAPAAASAEATASADGYKTCFMKRSVVYVDGAPKAVTARQCVE